MCATMGLASVYKNPISKCPAVGADPGVVIAVEIETVIIYQ